MTSDLSSALEVCFKRDVLNKSMFTLLYFTLLYLEGPSCQGWRGSTVLIAAFLAIHQYVKKDDGKSSCKWTTGCMLG